MNLQLKNELGTIEITKDVISSVASKAALDCYGLAAVTASNITEGISDLLRKESTKGVRVEVTEGNRLIVEVNIIVIYGTKISEVANNVMEKVHYTLEEMLGARVEKVNVKVQGVKVLD